MTAAYAVPAPDGTPRPLPAAAAAPLLRLVPRPAPESGIWWARIPRRATAPVEHSLVGVASDRFPAGTAVDLAAADSRGRRPSGWLVDVRYRAGTGTALTVDVAGPGEDRPRPRPCFLLVPAPGAPVPTVTLHAFTPAGAAPGAVLCPGRVPASARHLGAVRWWIRSGLVDGVRVEPAFRGLGYGRLLVHAAEGLRALHGWAPLRGDGRLTDTAAGWLDRAPLWWAQRLATRTACLPPEPEPGTPTGVERLIGDLPSRLI